MNRLSSLPWSARPCQMPSRLRRHHCRVRRPAVRGRPRWGSRCAYRDGRRAPYYRVLPHARCRGRHRRSSGGSAPREIRAARREHGPHAGSAYRIYSRRSSRHLNMMKSVGCAGLPLGCQLWQTLKLQVIDGLKIVTPSSASQLMSPRVTRWFRCARASQLAK